MILIRWRVFARECCVSSTPTRKSTRWYSPAAPRVLFTRSAKPFHGLNAPSSTISLRWVIAEVFMSRVTTRWWAFASSPRVSAEASDRSMRRRWKRCFPMVEKSYAIRLLWMSSKMYTNHLQMVNNIFTKYLQMVNKIYTKHLQMVNSIFTKQLQTTTIPSTKPHLQTRSKPPSASSPSPPKTTSPASSTLFNGPRRSTRTDSMYTPSRSRTVELNMVRSARRRRLRPHEPAESLGNQA